MGERREVNILYEVKGTGACRYSNNNGKLSLILNLHINIMAVTANGGN